jgi:hypothetical protein
LVLSSEMARSSFCLLWETLFTQNPDDNIKWQLLYLMT